MQTTPVTNNIHANQPLTLNREARTSAAAALLLTTLAPFVGLGCGPSLDTEAIVGAATTEPAAFSTWVRNARIAGAAVRKGMSQNEMNQLMSTLAAQNVSVVEADFEEGLSRYMTEAEFDLFLEPMRQLAAAAHNQGLKIVLYYASLEVLTPNGVSLAHTMAKDHPSWVQVSLDGKPNVAYGGSPTTPWVEPNMEDAWMSPSSPYRDIYFARAAKIAATGLDGLWVDVPLYAAWGTSLWNDVSSFAASKFLAATGYAAPRSEDWSSPVWRRWIAWRHQELHDFIAGVAKAARPQPSSEFVVLVETLPTDYTGSTIWGLEGAELRSIPGVACVWEVSTLSVNTAMRRAREDDWISYISMQKYIRAASGSKPSWSFAYAKNADDAGLVAGEALAARNNVYELKQPEMASTVSPAHRQKLFDWIRSNEASLFGSTAAARVAILYSPASRDYVDKFSALGQYVTTNSADELWWESDPSGSAYRLQYVAEYRGLVKLLVHNHIPFEVVVKPASASELARYEALLVPDLEAISNAEAQLLKDYVSNGGRLIVTGPNPGGWNEHGTSRAEYALSAVLGVSKLGALPSSKVQTYGAGEGRFFSALLGRQYYTNASNASTASATLLAAINATSTPWLTTSADKKVHIELSQSTNKLFLQYVNFIGLTGTFSVSPTTAATTLKTPSGKEVSAVELTSPDDTVPALSPLAFSRAGQDVSFTVPVKEYALVIITLRNAGSVANQPPVARADSLSALQGAPLSFTAAQLLSNDTDANVGDVLTLTAVAAASARGVAITNLGGGSYRYTAPGFVGSDSFTYTLSDNRGGSATGTVTVTVSAVGSTPATYSPQGVIVLKGTFDYGTVTSLKTQDADTYDTRSAYDAADSGGVTDWYARTTMAGAPSSVSQIVVTYSGQYSKSGVSQRLYVYNFRNATWDLFDTRSVGNTSDVTVTATVSTRASDYVASSPAGEMRVRVKGVRAGAQTSSNVAFYSWANYLSWAVR